MCIDIQLCIDIHFKYVVRMQHLIIKQVAKMKTYIAKVELR